MKFLGILYLYLRTIVDVSAQDYDFNAQIVGRNDSTLLDYDDLICLSCQCYKETSSSFFIDCNNLNLESLPDWLDELENVTDTMFLDLSFNAISEISSFPSIDVWNLDLSYNGLRTIKSEALLGVSQSVLQLDLSANKLDVTGLEEDCFKGVSDDENSTAFNVIDLSLARNRLHTVRPGLFKYFGKLVDLDLSENPLDPLTEEMIIELSSLSTLESLILRSTSLRFLPESLLAGLVNLKYLDLSGNRFTQVDPNLRLAPTLESLILDDNLISLLNQDSFQGLDNLRNLSLSNMHSLRSVEELTFKPVPNLQLLRISNNKQLAWISPDAWPTDSDQPLALKELDLSKNDLRYLPSMLLHDFQDWNSIDVIDIQDNPWECDCHNEWIISTLAPIIHDSHPELAQNILCGGPRGSALVKEEIIVIQQLTSVDQLPCDDKQFNPWLRNFNLPSQQMSSPPRPSKKSLPLALTLTCVFSIIATSMMVGVLYLQKSRRAGRRVLRRNPGAASARMGYVPTSNSGAETGRAAGGRYTDLPDRQQQTGVHNQHYLDDEGLEAGSPNENQLRRQTSHPFGRPTSEES